MDRTDSHGNPVSQCSAQALEGLEQASWLFHGLYADPVARIDEVLAEEPDFAMGLCLKGGMFATTSEKSLEPAIAEIVQRLQGIAHCNARERGHLAALQSWAAGDFAGAVEAWSAVLHEHPRDLPALQFAHLCDFLLGQSTMLRDRPAQALYAWSPDMPGYGFVRGMHAFGLEESGHYDDAERAGREALDANPRDPWAVHAVAHVMEMQGRTGDGIAWLEGRAQDWSPGNMLAYHNWWHLALHHLDRGDFAQVLRLYDEHVRPACGDVLMELVDTSALLWRLRLREADVGERWEEPAQRWERTVDDGYYAFNDVHAMMALAVTGREDAARRLLATMERAGASGGTNAAVTQRVGLPVARALLAFSQARYDAALDELLPVLPIAQRFGGSHAQRDLLSLTAVEAALRAGRLGAARALVSQRLAAKPASAHNQELAARASLVRLL